MLCKHEVVGSIPSGSTRCDPDPVCFHSRVFSSRPQENQFAYAIRDGRVCVLSDIVKKRSIRVWDREALPQGKCIALPIRYLQFIFGAPSSQDDRVVK